MLPGVPNAAGGENGEQLRAWAGGAAAAEVDGVRVRLELHREPVASQARRQRSLSSQYMKKPSSKPSSSSRKERRTSRQAPESQSAGPGAS